MKLLLLAGTAEARALATRLAVDPRLEVIASLAGATRDPAPLPVATRAGGFGGEAAQEKWMRDNGIEGVIDATHPFAARISTRTAALCARLGLPRVQLLRPGWTEREGDAWTRVPDMAAAAAAIPPGATAFLATGRQSLDAFRHRHDATLYLRVVDPPRAPFPLTKGGWIVGRPPFSMASDIQLFKDLSVEVLVAKDAGGTGGAKLDAARALGLPVILVTRPAPPPGDIVATVEDALAWLEARL